MTSNRKSFIAAAVLVGLLFTAALAQTATRINFARGASSATLSGTVADSGTKDYVLRAKKGQTLNATITSACDGINFQIFDAGTGQSLSEAVTEFEDELPGTDDYTIRVGNESESTCKFTLKVRVR